MSSPRLLGALLLLPVALLGAGCNCPGGGPADAGFTISLTLAGQGRVYRTQAADGGRDLVCASASSPCSGLAAAPGDTLTAEAAEGAEFVRWSCAGVVTTEPTLQPPLSGPVSCTVTFRPVQQRLEVSITDGRGAAVGGTVTSSPVGVECGTAAGSCVLMVDRGTRVTLTAVPDPYYAFVGWAGRCTGTAPTAEVTLNGPETCQARFSRFRYPLSLSVTGVGELDATLPDGGALTSCAAPSCPAVTVDAPEVVGLAAVPGPNRRVASWKGDCAAAAAGLGSAVTMDAPRECQLAVVLVDHGLTLARTGTGAGTVAADPASTTTDGGVPAYPHGTVVRLTAAPDATSDFTGWQGDCAGTALSTTVTLDADRACTAVFTLKVRTLTVTASTHGTVTSTPAGIDTARGVSSAGFSHGTVVQLAAVPDAHYEAVFSGACSATGQVTLLASAACGVTFRLVKQTLTATPVGSGSVTSAPAGIDTKVGKLSAAYDWGTSVTLTATPNVGGTQISFVGWSGDCAGTTPSVVVTLDASKSCTASFTVTPYDLTVAVTPAAGGAVTGKVGGVGANVISCGGGGTDCTEAQIASDRTVTLVAAPAAGYRFDRWSGCATDTTPTLVVPMTSNKTCTASFLKQWTVTLTTLTGPGTVLLDRSSTGAGGDTTCSAGGCSQLVDANETVTLTAQPANGTTLLEAFTCSSGTRAGAVYTVVNPTADVTCSVTFHQRYTVAVSASGAGGSVASAPAGISACTSAGGTCSALFLSGDTVVLTATPAANNQVAWSTTAGGVCDGTVSAGAGQAQLMTLSALGGDKACTAGFTPIQVTVNGKAGPNGTVAPLSTTVTSGGAGTTLTATPAASYHVLAWSGAFTAGSGTATGCGGTAASVTVAVSGATPGAVYDCTATFAVNTVTVNGKAGSNGTVAPATTPGVAVGSPALTLTATPAASYHLVSWSGAFTSGSGTATGCSGAGPTVAVAITAASDGAVYDCTATFAINTVTVNGRSGGNGTVAPATVVVNVGAAGVALGATPAANYHLTGWSGAFTTGSGTAAGCSGTAGTVAVTISAATDGAVYDCTATFAINTATIAGLAGANGTVAPASTPGVAVGSPATTLTATPAANYHVAGWTGTFTTGSGTATGCSGAGTTAAVAITGATDGAVYACTATFALNTVTLNGRSGGNGTVAPGTTTGLGVGAPAVTLTATPATNFHLASWSGAFTSGSGTATGCSGTGPTVAVAITAASDGAVYDCTATFAVNVVTVNGRAGANGSVAPASTFASSGGPGVTLTATPAANYHLTGWSGAFTSGSGTATGCAGTALGVTVAVSGATDGAVYACTATFAVNGVTVAGVASGSGTVGPASTATTVGAAPVTLTATPAANFHLVGWSGAFTAGSGTATGCSGAALTVPVAVTGGTDGAVYTCTATFAVNGVTVAGVASGSGAVAPPSTPTTVGAAAVTLTATPAANNHLVSWSGAFTAGSGTAAGCSGTAASVAVTVSAGSDGAVYTCTATFALNTVTLSGKAGPNGSVAPASTVIGVGAGGVTLFATPAANYHFAVWSGAFTAGSGTASGCTGGGTSTVVSFSTGTDGAAFDCTGTFAINNVTIEGSAGANGAVAPATTATTVGAAPVTLTATPAANYHLAGWTGTFLAGSGTATGCSGAAPTAAVVLTGATEGAVYDCHATFAINDVVVNGAAAGSGSVSPASTASTVGAPAITLTATPAANQHLTGWAGAFTSGSGTASGCSGSAPTVAVSVSSASQGAVYVCTATFAVNSVTVNGLAPANGTVAPASTVVSAGPGVATLTATPAANHHLTGWSGSFSAGSGTATGCSGTALSVAVAVTAGSDGAVFDCTATFAINTVTVNGKAGASGAVAPATTAGVAVGSPALTLTATPAANFHVAGWSGTFTSGSGTATGCSGAGPTVAVSVSAATDGAVYDCTATFALNTVTLTGSSGGNGAVAPASTTFGVGAPATTLTATPAANFHLVSWSGAFVTGSGTATGCSGAAASVAVSITAATDGAVYDCTATFAINSVTVAGASGGNGSVAPASTLTTVGAAATTLTATPAANYHLTGWSGAFTAGSGTATGCSGAVGSVAVGVTGGTDGAVYTCTATFALNTVTLTGTSGGNGSVAPASTSLTVGAPATTLTATPAANYHLTGWSGAFTSGSGTATGCSGAAGSVAVAISAATDGAVYDCTATFAINDVTVAGASGGNGAVAPASTATTVGAAAITLTATPDASYHLASWSGAFTTGSGTATGCSGTGATVAVAVSGATQGAVYTCTASFAVNAVTLDGLAGANGSVAPASAAVTVGAAATTFTATPAASHHVAGWSGGFTSGTGTATGCSGTGTSVAVAVSAGSQGAVYACTASFAPNDVTVAGASAGNGAVAPASTATTVGAAATTLTATPDPSYHLASWSGAFTSGSGTATGCSGAGATVAVAVSGATQGAVYTCTATFAPNTVAVAGAAGTGGAVGPASGTATVGGAGVTLTATPASGYRVLSWSGGFTTGSGTAAGCSGSGASVTVTFSAATAGAAYACTASFQPQATLTVRVVPAPSGATSFGLVSSPCTVASGASTCSVTVDVGASATLTTTEATGGLGQATSRFVRWACSGGAGSTARSMATTVSGDTTCVAQYYGLWSRYLAFDGVREATAPEVAALPPGTSGGLPTAASTFVVDAHDDPTGSPALLGWLAADDQPTPLLTDRAQPGLGASAAALTTSGDDSPGLAGQDAPAAGRTRALSGGYLAGRTASGVVSSLGRAAFSEWYFPDPGGGSTIDTAFLGGAESATHLQALGGYRALTTTAGQVVTARQGLVVVADGAGNASAWGAFAFPGLVQATTCSIPWTTTVRGVLWDPDPTNPGGLVVVGDYLEVDGCVQGQACPPDPGTQHAYGFVAKLDAAMGLLRMKGLAPGSQQAFSALAVVENLARTGYVVLGQVAGAAVGVVELSHDLSNVSLQLALQVADPGNLQSGLAPTTLEDALVDRTGNRYLVLTSASLVGAGSDVVVLSLDATGAPIAGDGWRFGTPGLDERGHRLAQPSEGGFVFTGEGPVASQGPRRAWVTRTNERFEVPFTGAAPGLARSAAAPGAPVDLALTGSAFTCTNGWVDLTRPLQAPVVTGPSSFTPAVTVQAP